MKWISKIVLIAFLLVNQAYPAQAEIDPPFELPGRNEVLKIRSAILETSKGTIFIELFPEDAPWHVANFKYLADKGFYNELKFHLYKPGYLIQGGDPRGNGLGGPGYTLPPEFSERHHRFGTLSMSRQPDVSDSRGRQINPGRRSSGSQFRLLLGEADNMDGQFTVFGKVVGGADVLEALREQDTITGLRVFIREGGR